MHHHKLRDNDALLCDENVLVEVSKVGCVMFVVCLNFVVFVVLVVE